MASFSEKSLRKLTTCDARLIELFSEVVKYFDCTIFWGYRDKEAQDRAFRIGNSKKKYPNSKHNNYPSRAIDVAPYPVNWEDRERFTLFAGYVLGSASQLGISIRWGGDWDKDTEVEDNKFDDLCHFELEE